MTPIKNDHIVFIINPYSGSIGIKKIKQTLETINPKFSVVITRSIEQLNEVFNHPKHQFKVFVLIGGDGTIKHAIPHFINNHDKIMAIFPNGSGNGFAKELGFKRNIQSLIKDIQKGIYMDIDCMRINDEYAVNVCGLGIDANVAQMFSKSTKRGLLTYIKLVIKVAFTYKPIQISLKTKDLNIQGRYLLVCFANSSQFGNNFYIAPNASPCDGKIQLILVKALPKFCYPFILYAMMFKKHINSKYASYHTLDSNCTVQSSDPIFHTDGEPLLCKDCLNVSLQPKSIRIIKTRFNNH